jgi:hypothetical protein
MLNKLDLTILELEIISKRAGIETDPFRKIKFATLALLSRDNPLAISSMFK